jgi:propanol-preferring alcohol dehydrogenase
MHAAVAEQLGQPLVLREVPQPALGPEDVLLQVKACGICYTDLRVIDALGAATLPLIPGHEPVGVVAAVGTAVTTVQPGDRVGAHALFSCGTCDWCRVGEEEACVLGTARLAGLGLDGGYAEYLRLPAAHALPLPEGMAFTDAAPLFCAGLTTYAALKNGNLQAGQRVVIVGIGGLGHLAIPIARALGATVYAVTTSPDKANLARELGASVVGDVATIVQELERAGGAHVLLNTANALDPLGPLAPTLVKQGTIVLTAADGPAFPFPPALVLGRQLRVVGSFYGSRQDLRELLTLAHQHRIRPVTELYPLAAVNAAHARLRANQVRYRAVLTP